MLTVVPPCVPGGRHLATTRIRGDALLERVLQLRREIAGCLRAVGDEAVVLPSFHRPVVAGREVVGKLDDQRWEIRALGVEEVYRLIGA